MIDRKFLGGVFICTLTGLLTQSLFVVTGALEIIGHPEQRVIIDMQTGKVEVASEAFRTCRTSCFLRREAQFMNLGYDFTETCYKCFKNQSYC